MPEISRAPIANRRRPPYSGDSVPFNLNNDNDDRPVTPTGQRTSPKTTKYWSYVLANQRKNKNYKK